MTLGTLLLMVVLGFLLLIVTVAAGLVFRIQNKNRKDVEGKRLCTILMKGGDRLDLLLPLEGDVVKHKVTVNDAGKKVDIMVPYLVRPFKSFNAWWPYGRSRLFQVPIKSYVYEESNPEPWHPFSTEPIITGELMGNMLDTSFSRAMLGRSIEEADKLPAPPKKKTPPVVLYVVLGLGLLILLGLGYTVMKSQGAIP